MRAMTPRTLDTKHLKMINVIIASGGTVECADPSLDRFRDDRGEDPDTINGAIEAGFVRRSKGKLFAGKPG